MTSLEIQLLLKALDLAVFGLTRLPARNAEREAALERLSAMVRNGRQPKPADFQLALKAIEQQAAVRDNLIALKGGAPEPVERWTEELLDVSE